MSDHSTNFSFPCVHPYFFLHFPQITISRYDFFPMSWVLPYDYDELRRQFGPGGSSGGAFIIKPPASARGQGIRVISDFSQLPKKAKSALVQEYLGSPLLIDGYKFDLRFYVLVTSFDPLRAYLYADGLVRICTEKYKKGAKYASQKFMHLTNYSLQKNREGFVENEDADEDGFGFKWSLTALRRWFAARGIDDKKLWADIDDVVVKTLISVEEAVNTACGMYARKRNTCYECFGFDILIDEKLKPWLVEVNVSPSLNSSSPLDKFRGR
jgi:hypothetical protein